MAFIFELDLLTIDIKANIRGIHTSGADCTFSSDYADVAGDLRLLTKGTKRESLTAWAKAMAGDQEHHEIEGEYAVAAILTRPNIVVLTRDWSGIGNIFYTIENGRIVVGTNVFQVLSKKKYRLFSEVSCAEYLAYEYVSDPYTLFEGVFSVPRGHTVLIDRDGRVVVKGNHRLLVRTVEEPEIYTELRNRIRRAHELRLDRVNGVYLSGGIDSSVMAITLKRDLGLSDVWAFSFGTLGAEQNETGDAKRVAQQLSLSYERVMVDPYAAIDLPALIDCSNFPYPGVIFLASIAARIADLRIENINLFAGQDTRLHTPPYNIVDRIALHYLLKNRLLRGLASSGGKLLQCMLGKSRLRRGAERLGASANLAEYIQSHFFHCHRDGAVTNSHGGVLASESLRKAIAENVSLDSSSRNVFNDIVRLSWDRQYVSDIAYMSGATEAFGNRCSMPFYDKSLSEFSAGLPFNLALKQTSGRIGHGSKKTRVNKYILRKAYERDLTGDMIFREKAVCITGHLFLNGCLSGFISEYFAKPRLLDTTLGDRLNLSQIYANANKKNGKWEIKDYEQVVETHNLLFLEVISRKYDVHC